MSFEIPVVLFLFKRKKAVDIIKRIAEVKPQTIYLIADGPRTEEEKKEVEECRESVERAISWDCKIIKNYSECNRGVFENIGLGAKWVFEREEKAIFLEDDNLPEVSFFYFCRELLHYYEEDSRIMWICGTNYLTEYNPVNKSSYVFTKHLLPCGWASWSWKFNKFYDTKLELCLDSEMLKSVEKQYYSKGLFKQYKRCWQSERRRMEKGLKPASWDYHMDFSIKANSLYGISPCYNQIVNIGVDEFSIHGGTNNQDIMTKRFCGMPSKEISFPLIHPERVLIDDEYEKRVAKILKYPLRRRIKNLWTKLKKLVKVKENN